MPVLSPASAGIGRRELRPAGTKCLSLPGPSIRKKLKRQSKGTRSGIRNSFFTTFLRRRRSFISCRSGIMLTTFSGNIPPRISLRAPMPVRDSTRSSTLPGAISGYPASWESLVFHLFLGLWPVAKILRSTFVVVLVSGVVFGIPYAGCRISSSPGCH